jgi:hypothetical protein
VGWFDGGGNNGKQVQNEKHKPSGKHWIASVRSFWV